MTTSDETPPYVRVLHQVDVVLAEHEVLTEKVDALLPPEIRSKGAEYWALRSRAASRTLSAFDLPERLVGEPRSESTP
jgi:hypothetical protein